MEKNIPISVAFEDIRKHPDIIANSVFRFINDDLGMEESSVSCKGKDGFPSTL